jgi:hypothetical protein
VVKVYNVRESLRITFDLERGILLSAQAGGSQDVVYVSPTTGTFPIVDNYGGFSKFGYLEGQTTYEDHQDSIGVAWTLSLVDSE